MPEGKEIIILKERLNGPADNTPVYTVPEHHYFFMGDNRNHSHDSRAFGAIHREQIVGRAIVRWWPPPKWGILSYNYSDPVQ